MNKHAAVLLIVAIVSLVQVTCAMHVTGKPVPISDITRNLTALNSKFVSGMKNANRTLLESAFAANVSGKLCSNSCSSFSTRTTLVEALLEFRAQFSSVAFLPKQEAVFTEGVAIMVPIDVAGVVSGAPYNKNSTVMRQAAFYGESLAEMPHISSFDVFEFYMDPIDEVQSNATQMLNTAMIWFDNIAKRKVGSMSSLMAPGFSARVGLETGNAGWKVMDGPQYIQNLQQEVATMISSAMKAYSYTATSNVLTFHYNRGWVDKVPGRLYAATQCMMTVTFVGGNDYRIVSIRQIQENDVGRRKSLAAEGPGGPNTVDAHSNGTYFTVMFDYAYLANSKTIWGQVLDSNVTYTLCSYLFKTSLHSAACKSFVGLGAALPYLMWHNVHDGADMLDNVLPVTNTLTTMSEARRVAVDRNRDASEWFVNSFLTTTMDWSLTSVIDARLVNMPLRDVAVGNNTAKFNTFKRIMDEICAGNVTNAAALLTPTFTYSVNPADTNNVTSLNKMEWAKFFTGLSQDYFMGYEIMNWASYSNVLSVSYKFSMAPKGTAGIPTSGYTVLEVAFVGGASIVVDDISGISS